MIKVEDKSSEGAAGDGVTALKCPIAGGATKPDQTAGNYRLFIMLTSPTGKKHIGTSLIFSFSTRYGTVDFNFSFFL
jgi:hypothetical protein